VCSSLGLARATVLADSSRLEEPKEAEPEWALVERVRLPAHRERGIGVSANTASYLSKKSGTVPTTSIT